MNKQAIHASEIRAMKLKLNRKWFEDRITAEDNFEVGAGASPEATVDEHKFREVTTTNDIVQSLIALIRDRELSHIGMSSHDRRNLYRRYKAATLDLSDLAAVSRYVAPELLDNRSGVKLKQSVIDKLVECEILRQEKPAPFTRRYVIVEEYGKREHVSYC